MAAANAEAGRGGLDVSQVALHAQVAQALLPLLLRRLLGGLLEHRSRELLGELQVATFDRTARREETNVRRRARQLRSDGEVAAGLVETAEIIRLQEGKRERDAPIVAALPYSLGEQRYRLQDVGDLAIRGLPRHGVSGEAVRAGELRVEIGRVREEPVQRAVVVPPLLERLCLRSAASMDLDGFEEHQV